MQFLKGARDVCAAIFAVCIVASALAAQELPPTDSPAVLRPGDVVTVKGSHAGRIDRIVERLRAQAASGGA